MKHYLPTWVTHDTATQSTTKHGRSCHFQDLGMFFAHSKNMCHVSIYTTRSKYLLRDTLPYFQKASFILLTRLLYFTCQVMASPSAPVTWVVPPQPVSSRHVTSLDGGRSNGHNRPMGVKAGRPRSRSRMAMAILLGNKQRTREIFGRGGFVSFANCTTVSLRQIHDAEEEEACIAFGRLS